MAGVCCFTGHRKIEERDLKKLKKDLISTLENLIENEGIEEFRTGGALGFDTLAADAVLFLKQTYPQIKLVIYVPCMDQNKYYSAEQNQKYLFHLNSADKILCISENYYKGCMLERNRALVNGADVCIAYKRKNEGGTAYTVSYAEQNAVKTIIL